MSPQLIIRPNSTASKDTFLYSDAAGTNYNDNVQIYVGRHPTSNAIYRSLIQFDLTPIPSSSIVNAATLSLTLQADDSSAVCTISVYRVLVAWSASQATYNNRLTGVAWATVGCDGATDREATPIASHSIPGTIAPLSVRDIVLDAMSVQQMLSGDFSNNGFLVKLNPESNYNRYGFYSSSTGTETYRPKLTIDYTLRDSGRQFQAVFFC